MSDRPFVLAQISDLHVTAREDGEAVVRLRRTLSSIAAHAPDAIIATGDLVDEGSALEYGRLAEALEDAPAPVFLLPGNHDDAATLRRAFPLHAYLPHEPPLCYALDHLPVRIVAIDQTFPGLVGGLFLPEHAEWLNETLSSDVSPTIVALHHRPFATHTGLDDVGLGGADLFEAVIERHPHVLRIVCGHMHRAIAGRVASVDALSCPSTARAFSVDLGGGDASAIDEPPGYLLHVWRSNGGPASFVMSA
jgi:3',5'-cyclic AMP phosphodiesterase CpdA